MNLKERADVGGTRIYCTQWATGTKERRGSICGPQLDGIKAKKKKTAIVRGSHVIYYINIILFIFSSKEFLVRFKLPE